MDGVLAEFEERYVEKFGEFPKDLDKRRQHFWNNWKKFVDDADFETLEKHKNCDKLLEVVRSLKLPVEILSSSSGGYSHEAVTKQKQKWLDSNGIEFKANIVPGGSHKARFASPWNVLIDDTQHIIDLYRKAGGTAIHHVDIDQTIKQLHALHLEWEGGE